jgi:hypothetical protein
MHAASAPMRPRPQSFVMLPYQMQQGALQYPPPPGRDAGPPMSQLAAAHDLIQLGLGSRPMQYPLGEVEQGHSEAGARMAQSDQDLASALKMSMHAADVGFILAFYSLRLCLLVVL